ncbi:MAG TPA: S8 family serine peptidase [Longimicrobium sp.]|nr:S8 family serine peptidase [Longimicrobium sp.]
MRFRSPLAACCLVLAAACTDQVSSPDRDVDARSATARIPRFSKGSVPLPANIDPSFVVPGHYNVIFRKGVNARAVTAEIEAAYGLSPSHRWNEEWIAGFSAAMDDKKLEKVRRHPHVEYVYPVVIGHVKGTLYYPYNWGLDRIDQRYLPLDNAYVYSDSAPNVRVYVVDTGIRRTHTDFEGRALLGTDVVTPGGTGADCNGHGTFVSAIIGGREYGVAKKARLYAVRAARCDGTVLSNDAITAANWVTNNHVKPAVANMSLGFPVQVPDLDQAIYASIQKGVTWVVAAGNEGVDACTQTPGHTLGTITVGATDSTDWRWYDYAGHESNWGACLNLFAPGAEIESAWIGSDTDYAVGSGTSFAAPHVAGMAANYLGRNTTATPATVKSAIVNAATPNVVNDAGTGSPNRLAYSRF